MSNTAGPAIPAGWYRDPAGSEQLRWWDGTAWTAHLAPQPLAAPAPVVETPIVQAPAAVASAAQVPAFSPAPIFRPTGEYEPVRQLDENPYVPFQTSLTTNGIPYVATTMPADFARPAQWNTAGGWFLGTSQLWAGILSGIGLAIIGSSIGFQTIATTQQLSGTALGAILGVSVIIWLLLIVAAARDQARLRQLGFLGATSVLWVLLVPPLVYLIIRTVRVRRESGHGIAPLVFYLVSYVAVILLGVTVAIAIPVFLAAHGGATNSLTNTANATSLASGIQSGLENGNGTYKVTCTPFAAPTTAAVEVTCSALDLNSHVNHALTIMVSPGTTGGKPSFKLLSVSPPITN